jgi:hypothetical protein
MAEILSLQYKSVFSKPIHDKELDDLKSFFEPEESQLSFPPKKIVKAMKSFLSSSSHQIGQTSFTT